MAVFEKPTSFPSASQFLLGRVSRLREAPKQMDGLHGTMRSLTMSLAPGVRMAWPGPWGLGLGLGEVPWWSCRQEVGN